MNKATVLATLGLSLLGCSFRKEPPKTDREAFSKARFIVTWNEKAALAGALTGDEASLNQSGLRDLLPNVDESFISSENAITLPPIVPKCLYGEVRLKSAHDFSQTLFVRGRAIREDGSSLNLVTDIIKPSPKGRIMIQFCGLGVQFSETQRSNSDLFFDFFSSNQKIVTLGLKVRTPPTGLEITELNLSEWVNSTNFRQPESWLRSNSLRGPISLVRVLRIKNLETRPLEIQIPKSLAGEITQWTNELNYRDMGCSTVQTELPQNLVLSNELRAFPLDEDFPLRAWELDTETGPKDRIHLSIDPDQTKWVGVYGAGPDLSEWSIYGPKVPEINQVSVPGTCFTECIEYFPCPRFDPGCSVERPCSKYRSGRRPETFSTGTNRGPVLMNFEDASRNWDTRFSDLSLLDDMIPRKVNFLSTTKEAGWVR